MVIPPNGAFRWETVGGGGEKETTAAPPAETTAELVAVYAAAAAPCSSNNAALPVGAAMQLRQQKQQCGLASRAAMELHYQKQQCSFATDAASAAQSAVAIKAQFVYIYLAQCTYLDIVAFSVLLFLQNIVFLV
jgi:hypothetical protein